MSWHLFLVVLIILALVLAVLPPATRGKVNVPLWIPVAILGFVMLVLYWPIGGR